ncbi:MAG: NADP-specific glutamate dehydrogenase, partial [Candidatus Gastranaerophilales bacterium]|nr:NADP-specific glutamate dehydrogenase [Candidatus Gastranaerophilales bacterium]
NGCVYDENGINLDIVKEIKEVKRGRIKEYLNSVPSAKYTENSGTTPVVYTIKADIILPCATQNDINLETAKILVANGAIAVGEGANMPTTNEAIEYLQANNVLVAPAKAANAGGVATSALEMSQNSMRYSWTFEEVDKKLENIMKNIFKQCKDAAQEYGLGVNYVAGANIAAFNKVSKAMIAQGVI